MTPEEQRPRSLFSLHIHAYSAHRHTHLYTHFICCKKGASGCQQRAKRTSEVLELELQVAANHLLWVL